MIFLFCKKQRCRESNKKCRVKNDNPFFNLLSHVTSALKLLPRHFQSVSAWLYVTLPLFFFFFFKLFSDLNQDHQNSWYWPDLGVQEGNVGVGIQSWSLNLWCYQEIKINWLLYKMTANWSSTVQISLYFLSNLFFMLHFHEIEYFYVEF